MTNKYIPLILFRRELRCSAPYGSPMYIEYGGEIAAAYQKSVVAIDSMPQKPTL